MERGVEPYKDVMGHLELKWSRKDLNNDFFVFWKLILF